MRRGLRSVALLVTFVWGMVPGAPSRASAAEPEARPVYSFGVVPQFEQRKLYAVWSPIIDELTRRTGLSFKLVTTMSVEDFSRAYFREELDFAYVNPYHTLKVSTYSPLVADRAPLHGILVVGRDDPIRSVQELEGKVVAFPSPNALGASLLLRADLDRLFHVKVVPQYVKTHSSVYLHVAKGLAAAGGGVEKSLAEQKPEVRDALRVLYTTRSLPSHPITAHDRVPVAHQEKVRQALLAMDATPEGRALLAPIPTERLIGASRGDYEAIRALDLEAFWVDMWKEGPGR